MVRKRRTNQYLLQKMGVTLKGIAVALVMQINQLYQCPVHSNPAISSLLRTQKIYIQ